MREQQPKPLFDSFNKNLFAHTTRKIDQIKINNWRKTQNKKGKAKNYFAYNKHDRKFNGNPNLGENLRS
jgi:hypothetical protein